MSERQAKAARRRTRTSGSVSNDRVSSEKTNPKSSVTETPEEGNYPGVAIFRVPTDTPGNETVNIMPLNGMDHLAIPALLEKAFHISRENLGLNERTK